MAELIRGGTGSGAAAEEVAAKYGVSANTLKVQWGKWAKDNGYGDLVGTRGGGRRGGGRSSSGGQGGGAGAVYRPMDEDILTVMQQRRDALEVQIQAREEELDRLRGERERIERALSILGGEE